MITKIDDYSVYRFIFESVIDSVYPSVYNSGYMSIRNSVFILTSKDIRNSIHMSVHQMIQTGVVE